MGQTVKIDILSDVICPWCFIGKRRLEAALQSRPDIEATVRWHPFQLNPDMPPAGLDRSTYLRLKFGGEVPASKVYQAIEDAGTSADIPFNFGAIRRTPNTFAAHRLLYYAAENACQDAVVENLFRAYFYDGLDIGDREILVAIAADSDLDADDVRAYLDGHEGAEVVRMAEMRARQTGTTGVPCYIIDDRYAVSGAQDPEVFLQVLLVAQQQALEPNATVT